MTAMLMVLLASLAAGALPQIPPAAGGELKAFQARVDEYVEMHRRLEGPLPVLAVTTDMTDLRIRMTALRTRICSERGLTQGALITAGAAAELRAIIARTLTVEDLNDLVTELEEHTPPGMAAVTVNTPLPQDAPFVMIAPQLIRALPPLPPELRYVALGKSLIIWDSHADLVVEIVPGLFDPLTYQPQPAQKRDN